MTRKLSSIFLGLFFIFTAFGGNVIGNGDFELSTTPTASCWSTTGTQTYSIESTTPISGSRSAKIITGTMSTTVVAQGIYQMVSLPKSGTYTISFKAKSSVPCSIVASLEESFSNYAKLAITPYCVLTDTVKTFSFTISTTAMTGLCKFLIYYGNVPTKTSLWLDDVVVQEAAPLTNPNLCNGSFETTMSNAMYTPSGYHYNFRSTGTSTKAENQYYYGWTKLRLATVTDSAKIEFDKSVNKICGTQSLKYTMVSNGVVHATKSSDHQLAWVFAGARDKHYAITFKAKSSVNASVGFSVYSWNAVNYLPEKTVALTTTEKSYAYSTATAINQVENRTIMSFLMGQLPAGTSVWLDDVTLVEGMPVASISLSAATASINKNSSFLLTATVTPADAAIKTVNWVTSDSTIASVDVNGIVTAVSAGSATITATTMEGGFSASAVIKVLPASDVKVSLTAMPHTTEVVNPSRGFYRWIGTEMAPTTCVDNYTRLNWANVEPTLGNYDFSYIDNQVNVAMNDVAGRGRLGFAIRGVVEGTGLSYPAYLDSKMNAWYSTLKKCWVPDWNNAYYLERHDSLVAALGRRYNKNPGIGYVEIRSYGNWGEWHLGGFEAPIAPLTAITESSVRRLIDAYVKAFPDKQLIMMSDHTVGREYALSIQGLKYPIGWRRDSWCNAQFVNSEFIGSTLAMNRWKTAPVIVEAYGNSKNNFLSSQQQVIDYHISAVANGNFDWPTMSATSRDSILLSGRTSGYRYVLRNVSYPDTIVPGQTIRVSATWSNMGVAPIYEDWLVKFRLVNKTTGQVAWEGLSKLNLRKLLPTYNFATQLDVPVLTSDTLTLAANIVAGSYDFEVIVTDPIAYLSPLKLANSGLKANEAYDLGSVLIPGKITELNDQKTSDDFSVVKLTASQVQLEAYQSSVYTFSIFAIDGRCVYFSKKLSLSQGSHNIPISHLPKGIYVLKIGSSNQQKVIRYVVD